MFTVTKNARIHKSVVAESFSTAEVSGMKLEVGSNYYVWPFTGYVIGCGNECPEDHSPNGRSRFTLVDGYGIDDLCSDVRELANKLSTKTIVNALNRGVDLELRAKARPNPKARMSDADKMAWVIGNIDADQWAGKTPVEFVAIFEAQNG